MRPSLGILLALSLAGLQLIAVLAVVFSSYLTSERALLKHARDLLRDVGTNAIEHSKGFLGPAQGAAELAARLAQNRVVASDDPYQLEQLLFQQLQLTPQFAGLYFGGEDGAFVYVMRSIEDVAPYRSKIIHIDGQTRWTELIWRNDNFELIRRELDPEDVFDPRERPWYIDSRERMGTIWTDPYVFFSSQQPGITLASPVLGGATGLPGDTGLRGIVGVDIEISMISRFLSLLKIGETGRALIINRNGDVIAHPQLELLKTKDADGTLRLVNIDDFEDPVARTAFAGLALPVPVETPSQFKYRGSTYVSTLLPVISDILPWTIAVYAPEDDFTGVIKQNRTVNIWIAVAVALLTAIVGLLLANYIYRPVRAFAVRSTLVAQGEIDASATAPRTYRELERANAALVQQIIARRDAERTYGQTFELSGRAMAQISPEDGSIIRANVKFGELVGVPAEMTVGRTIDAVAHPDDLESYACVVRTNREPISNQDMRWIRRDGQTIWVRLNSIIIRDDTGVPVHGVLTVDDITEEKSRETQISQLSRDLSHLARGHTMGQMASGLAHELNQPLTAIAQNAGTALIILSQHAEPDPELHEILEAIEQQSLRAGDIIRALRSFIRKDQGGMARFDFAELLDQTLRLVHPEAVEARVLITTEVTPLPPVLANRVQIAQVLVNLLRNAIDALENDSTNDRRVQVRAELEADMVRISVSDAGPGVPGEVTLFAQFETSKPDGMGLGLSLCRTMIAGNGGTLWHEPNTPRGARFFFTLKIAPSKAPATTSEPDRDPHAQSDQLSV